jgi:hypothetical protein
MGLAHPDLVFRIQDSIITERKTLPLKNFKENPKKNAKVSEAIVCISLLAYRRLYARAPQRYK